MKRTWQLFALIGGLLSCGTQSLLLGQTPSAGIEQQLRSQYPITSVGNNGVVVRAGSVLVVQKDGILGFPAPEEWQCNAYKQGGKVKQSTGCNLNWAMAKDNTRPLQVGDKAYLTAIQVKLDKAEVVFRVQTCAENTDAIPLKAVVSFQFQKGQLDSIQFKEIQETISEIFAPDASNSVQGSGQERLNTPPGAQPAPFSGTYVSLFGGRNAHLQFNPDGSFAQHGPGDHENSGTFTVNGDTLTVTYPSTGRSGTFSIRGDTLYNTANTPVWARQGGAPAPAAPALPPLKLPSTYVSSQTPTDKLQLNADNSFSLQEGGQPYHGTFAANGNTLELNISETSTKTTLNRQGNDFTDSNGQTWNFREQSAGAAQAGAMLHNEDIIKMATAGFDDAFIIAKISGSRCQFDTSTDALIQLKKSGVSASILKAMMAR